MATKSAPELKFESRAAFRTWLAANGEVSDGIWIVFSKGGSFTSVTAAEALEEALCYGWIDGLMKSIDDGSYKKYFARRKVKSVWSDKNKSLVDRLTASGLMAAQGTKAVERSKFDGSWDQKRENIVTDERIIELENLLKGSELAHANFVKMAPSARKAYTGLYFSGKSDETRAKTLQTIIGRLELGLKPMQKLN